MVVIGGPPMPSTTAPYFNNQPPVAPAAGGAPGGVGWGTTGGGAPMYNTAQTGGQFGQPSQNFIVNPQAPAYQVVQPLSRNPESNRTFGLIILSVVLMVCLCNWICGGIALILSCMYYDLYIYLYSFKKQNTKNYGTILITN